MHVREPPQGLRKAAFMPSQGGGEGGTGDKGRDQSYHQTAGNVYDNKWIRRMLFFRKLIIYRLWFSNMQKIPLIYEFIQGLKKHKKNL